MAIQFNTIPELIEDIRAGKMVILVDDEDRENEGDLVLAADATDAQKINFMALEARGLICLALTSQQVDRLKIPLMVRDENNFTPNKTAFTVSIEASSGVSTGISASDRAHTVRVAANPAASPFDVHTPGHIFPIRAQNGGVLKRAGHTEGSVDLARMAGLNPAAVICEVMNPDGTMARVNDLALFAKKHQLKIGTIVDLIAYRLQTESLVEKIEEREILFEGESFQFSVFKSKLDHYEHIALTKGDVRDSGATLVRMHVADSARDFLTTLKGENPWTQALHALKQCDHGVFVLLRGLGHKENIQGLVNSVFSDSVQESGAPGPGKAGASMDERDYGLGAQILRALGVSRIRLLTNNPERKVGIKAYGLEIIETQPLSESH